MQEGVPDYKIIISGALQFNLWLDTFSVLGSPHMCNCKNINILSSHFICFFKYFCEFIAVIYSVKPDTLF